MSTKPFIFESCGERDAPVYKVYRRADREPMGFVERDCARAWVVRELNFALHDYVKGEGVISYRTRNVAAHVLHNAFEAGEVVGAKPSAEVVPVTRELSPDAAGASLNELVRALIESSEPDSVEES